MNLSASAFALGHSGVIFRWLNPRSSENSLNSWLLKGGPLSVFISIGMPWVERILSNFGIVAFAEVDFRILLPDTENIHQ
jgi:hypothetical protein